MALIKSAGLLGISERNRAVLVKLDDQTNARQASKQSRWGREIYRKTTTTGLRSGNGLMCSALEYLKCSSGIGQRISREFHSRESTLLVICAKVLQQYLTKCVPS